jgi:hypothetical protein
MSWGPSPPPCHEQALPVGGLGAEVARAHASIPAHRRVAPWPEHKVSMQRDLATQTMAEKQVFLGVRLTARSLECALHKAVSIRRRSPGHYVADRQGLDEHRPVMAKTPRTGAERIRFVLRTRDASGGILPRRLDGVDLARVCQRAASGLRVGCFRRGGALLKRLSCPAWRR